MSHKATKEQRRVEKLKGFKIDTRNYFVTNPEGGEDVEMDVKDNLASMLFHPELKQGPEEMFKAKDLADKIRASKDFILLDKAEMDRINRSYALLKGLPERFIELFMRIRDAEEVQLTEAR